MRHFLLLTILLFLPARAARERWIYLPANFQVDAEAARVISLMERAAALGFDHALVQDSKFSRLATVAANYRPNVEKVKVKARELKMKLVPAVFPVGYSNDMLASDPNLAAGLPVRDALYVIEGNQAKIVSDPPVALPSTESRIGWDFVDAPISAHEGALRSRPGNENARMHKKLTVSPFRQYHIGVDVRTSGLTGGKPEIKVIGADGRSLQWTDVTVKANQDFVRYDVTFNTLGNRQIGVYLGIWGGHGGAVDWRGAEIGECGPVNLLLRPSTPLVITREGGRKLVAGEDYEPVKNPLTGAKPWPGEYTAWHVAPEIRTKGFAGGTKLRVSYFHTHIFYQGQVCACVEEPAFQNLLREQADRVAELWQAKGHMMSHDEWRLIGWDPACLAGGKSPGGIAAENVRFCTGILREFVPGGRILVWSDMFDPFHNAMKNYYLANGSFVGSWEGLAPEIEVMNWNFEHRDQSLAFFAKRGNPQIIAGYYDGDLTNVSAWLKSADKIDGVRGFMYTTWNKDYSKLEAVAKLLGEAGW